MKLFLEIIGVLAIIIFIAVWWSAITIVIQGSMLLGLAYLGYRLYKRINAK